jgi:hypothetical protein
MFKSIIDFFYGQEPEVPGPSSSLVETDVYRYPFKIRDPPIEGYPDGGFGIRWICRGNDQLIQKFSDSQMITIKELRKMEKIPPITMIRKYMGRVVTTFVNVDKKHIFKDDYTIDLIKTPNPTICFWTSRN